MSDDREWKVETHPPDLSSGKEIMRVDLDQRFRPVAIFAVLVLDAIANVRCGNPVKLHENALYSSINLSRKANTFCMVSSLEHVAIDLKSIAFLKGFDNIERVRRKVRKGGAAVSGRGLQLLPRAVARADRGRTPLGSRARLRLRRLPPGSARGAVPGRGPQ